MEPLSDALLAGIVSLASDAIICIDSAQRITFFNDGATRIFGYQSSEVVGEPLELLIPVRFHHDHREHVESFGRSAVTARKMGERTPIAGRRKNGEEFPAEAAITRMQTPDGNVYSVVLRDVTERHRAEAVKQQLLARTEEAVRARDEMLGLVSHELRNPVNAVKMLASAILRVDKDDAGGPVPAAVSEHAAVMLEAATQMDRLIQDLLDVTRIEAGRMRLSLQPVELSDVAAAAHDMLTPAAAAKSVSLALELAPGLPKVHADPDRVTQLLSNLIGNAVKFTAPGGEVRIEAGVADGDVLVTVRDTGVGISAADLPKVFDRFWQSNRTTRSGAGLGLALSRGIVLAHGGRIWIESTVGKGTTVRFTLPV